LARAGVHDLHSIDLILAEADRCDLAAADLTTDAGLAAAIHFLFRLNIPFVRDDVSSCSSYVIKFIQRNRLLCLNSLFQVDIFRDAPDTVFAGYPVGRISG
jgi:hypothetical protein